MMFVKARLLAKRYGSRKKGMTLVEVVVSLTLFFALSIGGLKAITSLHNLARSQSTYNSVLALVVGKQESFRSELYAPPTAPFTDSVVTQTETLSVSLDASGANEMVSVAMVSTITPVSSGHLITVAASYAINGRSATVSTETVFNEYSAVNF